MRQNSYFYLAEVLDPVSIYLNANKMMLRVTLNAYFLFKIAKRPRFKI